MSKEKFKVIFINYGVYAGCCGVHIHFLANILVDMGYDCSVFLLRKDSVNDYFGEPNYPIYAFDDLESLPLEHFENSIIHVWTTREIVRHPVNMLRKRIKLPYIVHLEDNEVYIAGKYLGVYTLEEQKVFIKKNAQKFKAFPMTHPLHFESFMRASSGVTCIIKSLEEFVPKNVPRMTFWPACEDAFFLLPRQRNVRFRGVCGLTDDTYALAYPGAINQFNAMYFIEFLRAVHKLNCEGYPVKIIRCGIEDFAYDEEILELYKKYVVFFEDIAAYDLPYFMSVADFLVQPGAPRAFDDYRFPSKIPFFLASARPTILPNTNVADRLQHGHDCFLLEKGDAEEIAQYLKELILNPDLAQKMGDNGRNTARALFSWKKAAESLIPFYEQALRGKNFCDV